MITTSRNTTRLPTASLWAMKRRRIIWVWLRRWTVNSRSVVVAGTSWTWTPCSVVWRSCSVSAIAEPRVQHRVELSRDAIEQHHQPACHHQPVQRDVDVAGLDPLDEQRAHALPGEHPLGG